MKNNPSQVLGIFKVCLWSACLFMQVLISPTQSIAQCNPQSGAITGFVYADAQQDGIRSADDPGIPQVQVKLLAADGTLMGETLTNENGTYTFTGLQNGQDVLVIIGEASGYWPSFAGADNGTSVQRIKVPACNVSAGFSHAGHFCQENARILTTCFVQGETSVHPDEPTIVGIPYNFGLDTPPSKFASYAQTGTIWGLAWNKRSSEIYSAAFVKQFGGLTPHGHDAIFKTIEVPGQMPQTSLLFKLSSLGQQTGNLDVTDVNDCNYGRQVGKIGIGAIQMSGDHKYLYAVNLFEKTLVRIQLDNPTPANTVKYQIPDPGCHDGVYRPFALKWHNGILYVGVTCSAEVSKNSAHSTANVYAFDPVRATFSLIFSHNYIKGFWKDDNTSQIYHSHWLTDIEFTDQGSMILSLSDRLGHMYCNEANQHRLDEQKPDILMVWFDKITNTWKLESNGSAGALTGSGVGNGQGPGGGEFFGFEHWPKNPVYHAETALGSILAIPGTNAVVAAVFDPDYNAYSGGLHRYSTTNGALMGAKELYILNTSVAFGKATGFGDITCLCPLPSPEIGNLLWIDSNKDGIQNAGENGLAQIPIHLYDDNCFQIAVDVTDDEGHFQFNENNVFGGLVAGKTYHLGLDPQIINSANGTIHIDGEYYNWAPNLVNNLPYLDSDASFANRKCPNTHASVSLQQTNHQFDSGLIPSEDCGLQISASILQPGLKKITDYFDYELCVTNFGLSKVSGFKLELDLLPGQILQSQSWIVQGAKANLTVSESLFSGEQYCTVVRFKFNPSSQNIGLIQPFRISKVLDQYGIEISQSETCFQTPGSQEIIVEQDIFDLALRHHVKEDKIYSRGSEVTFVTTVFNQGTLPATSFTIINHLNAGLDFIPSLNPGWILSQDLKTLTFTHNQILLPGESVQIELHLAVLPDAEFGNLINYAEILGATSGGQKALDFDSDGDENEGNDKGGDINTATDNLISDKGVIDEDDHDPLMLRLIEVDLAIQKSVAGRRIYPNKPVTFQIEIHNKGKVAVSELYVRDYLPDYLLLNDSSWTLINGNAEKHINLASPLQPGEKVYTQITCLVKDNISLPLKLSNVVQLFKIMSITGEDITSLDAGSYRRGLLDPSELITGNLPEDDLYSFAEVVTISPFKDFPCNCKANSTNDVNGQFDVILELSSTSGEQWYVEQVVGLYSPMSPAPPSSPVVIPAGQILQEYIIGAGPYSVYRINGVHVDAQGFFIRVKNKYGDSEEYTLNPNTCVYEKLDITGPVSLCNNAEEPYVVTPLPYSYYTWYINGVDAGLSGNSSFINWGFFGLGYHDISVKVTTETGCYERANMTVGVGYGSSTSLTCIGELNVSLDDDCRVQVTPEMINSGTLEEEVPFIVMLMDKNGKNIPNATLTEDHLGTTVKAKLFEGCGGNSCWTILHVEDKIPPITHCQDIELSCYSLSDYHGPFETDNCAGPVRNILLNEVITPLDCHIEYISYIDRIYHAIDVAGNVSAPCSMRISVFRPNFRELTIPEDVSMANENPLVCDQYPVDQNGMPDPGFTGVPKLRNIPVYPSIEGECRIFAGYTDRDLGYIGCTRKIVRTWVIYESWCTSGFYETYDQMIEITDNIAPAIQPIKPITATTKVNVCLADIVLPAPAVTDICSGVKNVDVEYPGGFIPNFTSGKITLPVGEHMITYRAYDNCGNFSTTTFVVNIADLTPPVMTCKGDIVVSLNLEGEAYITPTHIDDGIDDPCGLDFTAIRRMGNTCLISDLGFGNKVSFCCDDVGRDNMVEVRAVDLEGNENFCMARVRVQDKIRPVISCPENVEIICENPVNLNNLGIYGQATYDDACLATITELTPVVNIGTCKTGVIERRFTVSDGQNQDACSQFIFIVNPDPFDIHTDVEFPEDISTTVSCAPADLTPARLNSRPVISEGLCDRIGVTYRDQVFYFVQGACFKIVRTWTIVDWCNRYEDGTYPERHYDQTIAVMNNVSPVITSSCTPKQACTPKGDCEQGFIALQATAQDDCTPAASLRWSIKIDLDNDGTYNDTLSGTGAIATGSGNYPVGSHRVQYTFLDRCGNLTTCDQLFSMANCDKPSAICKNEIGLAIVPMDTDGDGIEDIEMGCIQAIDVNNGSFHPCSNDLCFSFSQDTTDKERCFDCFEIGLTTLQLWVTDKQGGDTDVCNVRINVQDNNTVDICPDLDNCVQMNPSLQFRSCTAANIQTLGLNQGPVIVPSCRCTQVTITHRNGPVTSCGPNCQTLIREWSITFNCFTNPRTYIVNQTVTQIVDVPTANITGNTTICNGQSTQLTVTGTGTYLWSTGATTAAITVSPTLSTLYRVTVTSAAGCTASNGVQVTVNPRPNAAITGDLSICQGESTLLQASGGGTYRWSTNATTSAISVTPTANTTYTVTVTNAFGCTNTASATVEVTSESVSCQTRNITVFLNQIGQANITPAMISIGDTIGCAGNVQVSLAPRQFFCNLIGPNTVTLNVRNLLANINLSCTATVTVLDTIRPTVTCPPAATINCANFTPATLSGSFGSLIINDNCIGFTRVDTVITSNLNNCNVGTITRNFTVYDLSNNSRQCSQTINVVSQTPFNESGILWPASPVVINSCTKTIDLGITGVPEIDDSFADCSDVNILPFTDAGINPNTICRDTIFRTWTVVDSCQLVPNTNQGRWTFVQTIIIGDQTPPTFTNTLPDMSFTVPNPLCDTLLNLSGTTAADNCPGPVNIINNGLFAENNQSADASGRYDLGVHRIVFTASDQCSNAVNDTMFVNIYASRAYCVKQFLELPEGDTLDLNANNFSGYAAICPGSSHFLVSFSSNNPGDSIRRLDCSHVEEIDGRYITVYFFDTRSGDTLLWDSCIGHYFLYDPDGSCGSGLVDVSGTLKTVQQQLVPAAVVRLFGTEVAPASTGTQGIYQFNNIPKGIGIRIRPEKDDDVLKGVSTLDLINIQQHLTGIRSFERPDQWIAADINNDRKVNSVDMVELRKVILGILQKFPDNESWRFMEEGYVFSDPEEPLALPLPEESSVSWVSQPLELNFTGIKVGDVNGSYVSGLQSGTLEDRSEKVKDWSFVMPDAKARGLVQIPVSVTSSQYINGFQLSFEVPFITDIEIVSGVLDIQASNYICKDNKVVISWNTEKPLLTESGDVLFYVKGIHSDNADRTMRISRSLHAEMYDELLDVHHIRLLAIGVENNSNQLQLKGNTPNPWTQESQIRFFIPKDGEVECAVRSTTGKLLFRQKAFFEKGNNSFNISKDVMENAGLIFYDLKYNESVSTGKMIYIE